MKHDGTYFANFVRTIGDRGFSECEVPVPNVGQKSAFSARFGVRIENGIVYSAQVSERRRSSNVKQQKSQKIAFGVFRMNRVNAS